MKDKNAVVDKTTRNEIHKLSLKLNQSISRSVKLLKYGKPSKTRKCRARLKQVKKKKSTDVIIIFGNLKIE